MVAWTVRLLLAFHRNISRAGGGRARTLAQPPASQLQVQQPLRGGCRASRQPPGGAAPVAAARSGTRNAATLFSDTHDNNDSATSGCEMYRSIALSQRHLSRLLHPLTRTRHASRLRRHVN